MNAKDQLKVINAGFTIIRKEVTHVVSHLFTRKIKAKKSGRSEWHTLEEGFESTAALERRMKELLKDKKIIVD